MTKTTVYLNENAKHRLELAASRLGWSEAELIREAVDRFLAEEITPEPRLGIGASGQSDLSERVDEVLAEGFGR